jgi:hypothetical protein
MKTDALYIYIDIFEKLQIKHEKLMKEGIGGLTDKNENVPNLELMTEDREKAYRNIHNAFESINLEEEDILNLEELKSRIASVIKREDSLKKLVEEYRDGLKNAIGRLRNGRKAIKGYGGAF